MIKLKSNKNKVAKISTTLLLIGILKGYIKTPLIFVITAKIKYLDGTSDYFQTFCSDETYLLEQL